MVYRSDAPVEGTATDRGGVGWQAARSGRADRPANVLVRTAGPSSVPALPPLSDPDRTSVLAVTCTDSPAAHARRWRERDGALPAELGVLAVGRMAGGSTSRVDGGWTRDDGYAVATVAHPGDLTGIEIAVTSFLERLRSGAHRVALVDSLTVLLQYVDPDRAFRFLDALTDHLRAAGTRAYFYLTPEAHDDGTLAVLRTLFDAEIEVDQAGDDGEPASP